MSQEGRFAAAASAHDSENTAFINGQVDPVQDQSPIEALYEVFYLYHRSRHAGRDML